MAAAALVRLRHVVSDRDRHGNVRFYVRVRGARKRRLEGEEGSPEFFNSYAVQLSAALAEAGGERIRQREDKGSVGWLIEQYQASGAFTADLGEATQDRRRSALAEFRREHGTKQADGLPRKAVVALMDGWKRAHGPHGANSRLKALRGLYGWAVEREIIDRDATREVKSYRPKSDGFHTWTEGEIRQFMARWPLGTAPRVAMTVLLCTGFRVSDAYLVGPRHVQGRRIVYQPGKTAHSSGLTVSLPMLPMLTEALAVGPTGAETFIVGLRGRGFQSAKALSNEFKGWCVAADLPHCSAHGLRKGGATILAENGATSQQLMAIYGWTKLEMAEHYTRKAERSRLADALGAGFGLEEDG